VYITTLLFALNSKGEVLLAMKKKGFGQGKWNGPGGKSLEGESPEETAIRETKEEVGITVNSLEHRGTLDFHFAPAPGRDPYNRCEVYVTRDFSGEPQETDEMKPQWFPINAIPLKEMWEDDEQWLPDVLKGGTAALTCYFDEQFNLLRTEPKISADF
jgi:8-oxo-dGTP pyrophosphatase MutT (NUDIX family)